MESKRNKEGFSKGQIIKIGQRLANAGLIVNFPPRSHSHKVHVLFPQTAAQYDWLRRECGTTVNNVLLCTVAEVLAVCPELVGYVKPTNSRRFCRIDINL